jgi:hypothetical protein
MKTSRSQKDPLMPPELAILLTLIATAVIASALLPVVTAIIKYFKQ